MTDGIPALDIGDHVTDRDDPDATMLVVGLPLKRAGSVLIDGTSTTVADVNPDYPAEDPVVEIVFAGSADTDVDHAKRYAYPRSRLRCVTPIHSDDEHEFCLEPDCQKCAARAERVTQRRENVDGKVDE